MEVRFVPNPAVRFPLAMLMSPTCSTLATGYNVMPKVNDFSFGIIALVVQNERQAKSRRTK
jgi:hypothetical protein